jgi:hypothetical protein
LRRANAGNIKERPSSRAARYRDPGKTIDGLCLTQRTDDVTNANVKIMSRIAKLEAIQIEQADLGSSDERAPRAPRVPHNIAVQILGVSDEDLAVRRRHLDAGAIICAASSLPPLKITDLQII